MIKMINAMKATTKKMPQTIPALNIPDTTEQLPSAKTKKKAIEEINDLILFTTDISNRVPFFNPIEYPFRVC
jgi:hypothetical protein